MFMRNDEEFLNSPDLAQRYEAINRWFLELGEQGKFLGGEELQPGRNATTVRWAEGRPLVTDGPFIESKEIIGGFATVEAADLDEAIALAKRWPAQDHAVEIRPVVDHGQDH